MKKLTILFMLILSSQCYSQETIVPRHVICAELGANSRGMFGLGYNYNFMEGDFFYFSMHASAGVGMYYSSGGWFGDIDPSLYLTLSPSVNFGHERTFFTVGVEIKRLETQYEFSGYGAGGFLGMTFNGPVGLVFKARVGAVRWFDLPIDGPGADLIPRNYPLPMFGISFGYGFGLN